MDSLASRKKTIARGPRWMMARLRTLFQHKSKRFNKTKSRVSNITIKCVQLSAVTSQNLYCHNTLMLTQASKNHICRNIHKVRNLASITFATHTLMSGWMRLTRCRNEDFLSQSRNSNWYKQSFNLLCSRWMTARCIISCDHLSVPTAPKRASQCNGVVITTTVLRASARTSIAHRLSMKTYWHSRRSSVDRVVA